MSVISTLLMLSYSSTTSRSKLTLSVLSIIHRSCSPSISNVQDGTLIVTVELCSLMFNFFLLHECRQCKPGNWRDRLLLSKDLADKSTCVESRSKRRNKVTVNHYIGVQIIAPDASAITDERKDDLLGAPHDVAWS